MAVKLGEQFSAHSPGTGGQGLRTGWRWVRSPHSAHRGQGALFFLRGFHKPRDTPRLPSAVFSPDQSEGRHLISSLITRPNEMSAANAQVFNCCWNACRCQRSLGQGNHRSQQPLKGHEGSARSEQTPDLHLLHSRSFSSPSLCFPKPQTHSPLSPGNAVSQGFFYLIQNKCKCVT